MEKIDKIRFYVKHVIDSIEKADRYESKLTKPYLAIEGMSSPKVRHFLNNICSITNLNYLEVGMYKGSTFCAANCKNPGLNSFGIENFSEFVDKEHETNGLSVTEEFEKNIKKFIPKKQKATIVNVNCFEVDISQCPKIDVYFYDGNHSLLAHETALTYFHTALNDVFIYIVDDFMDSTNQPKIGTISAITKLGYKVRYLEELPKGDVDGYWGGLGIFVIEK